MTKDLVILLLLASVSLKAGAVLPSDFYQTEAGKVFSALLKMIEKISTAEIKLFLNGLRI